VTGRHPDTSGLEESNVHRPTSGPAQEPTVLAGRYELQEVIGGGGMATVYRAWDRAQRRPCAVKVLAEGLSRDEQFRLRFRQEAQAARGLAHPHIVAVYDYGESDPHHYIVMEYVARGTLRELLKREGALQEATAARLAAEVADALAYAHERGVIHRDIKPQNILLTEDGAAKVADFGIARSVDTTSLTRTGFVMGTVQYLSPEQARGEAAGPASDLYALGVVLFEMLAGRVPFDGDSAVGIALRHLGEPPPDPKRIRPDLSESMTAIVTRLLAKFEGERYPTAAALAVDLRRVASAHSWPPPRPTAVVEGVPGGTREFVPAPSGSSATRQAPPRMAETAQLSRIPDRRAFTEHRSMGFWAAGVAIFLALAAAGAGIWRSEHANVARPSKGAATQAGAASVDNGTMVPSLVGRTLEAASQTAGAVDLRVVVAERRQDPSAAAGTILAQDPPAGGRLTKGAPLKVIVSQGTGIVPELQGLSVTAAASRLEAAGLRLGRTVEGYGLGGETVGKIISQVHPAGSHLSPGESVDVIVSKGPMPSSPQPSAPAPPAPQTPTPQPPTQQPPAPEPSNP
jgi:eukaryotic-like serine/threonine-protein kinase